MHLNLVLRPQLLQLVVKLHILLLLELTDLNLGQLILSLCVFDVMLEGLNVKQEVLFSQFELLL